MAIKRIIHIALALLVISMPAAADDAAFEAADARLAAGEYEAARAGFASLIEAGQLAPEVFFGLGNSHYRLGDTGRAALAYRRALYLEPAFSEARQNLTFLTESGGLVDSTAIEGLAVRLVVPEAIVSGGIVVGVVLLLFSACFLIAMRDKPSWLLVASIFGVVAGLALASFSGLLAFQHHVSLPPPDSAIVVSAEAASAHSAPAPSSSEIISLPPGSLVRVEAVRGGWRYVGLPGGLKGWVDNGSLETLWPPK